MVRGSFPHEWLMRILGKTPLSPRGNCRFDSTMASPNPQSQQMISLACTTDSVWLAFMNEYKPSEARGWLRVDTNDGSTPTGIWDCILTEPPVKTGNGAGQCTTHTPMIKNMAVTSGQDVSVEWFFLCSTKLKVCWWNFSLKKSITFAPKTVMNRLYLGYLCIKSWLGWNTRDLVKDAPLVRKHQESNSSIG